MIRDREHPARSKIDQLPPEFLLDRQPALRTEMAVQMDRRVDPADPILREDDDLDVALREVIDQIADNRIDATKVVLDLRRVRAESLEVVVEMREVDEVQRRLMPVLNPLRRIRDPTAGGIGRTLRGMPTGGRSPERGKRELTEIALDLLADRIWPGVDVEELPSVGGVHRARRDRPVHLGIHVVPPEHLRAGES